jgi:hypothetical protein
MDGLVSYLAGITSNKVAFLGTPYDTETILVESGWGIFDFFTEIVRETAEQM